MSSAAAGPAYCNVEHNVGNIVMSVSNDGSFGNGWSLGGETDCVTHEQVKSCEYPKGSFTTYLWGADLWVGAIVGRDTLVSTAGMGGHEYHPDTTGITRRSNIDPAKEKEYLGAISEQDYIAVYYDTCLRCRGVGTDYLDGRSHRPLGIEVTQRSFAWSYSYAQDFVLMDFGIKNIRDDRLRQVYMGFYVDADIHSLGDNSGQGYEDDLSGFKKTLPALYLEPPCPPDSDEVNLAWTIDNNGDLIGSPYGPVPHAAAMRVVRTPADTLVVSYNWWIRNTDPALDFGPQARRTYRDLQTGGLGQPHGDRNKYHYLRNGEVDYDQPRVATISELDSIWLPPPQDRVARWATGLDVRYLISFGPFDIDPGQTLPISLAYVCGRDFHTDPGNFANLPNNPDSWYDGVNFDSLGANSTWAEWVYDNPGVDTDSDGYAGEFTICNLGDDSSYYCDTGIDTSADPDTLTVICSWQYELADTVWRKGDDVPDFRGATPPPSPASYSTTDANGNLVCGLRVEQQVGKIRVLWNGVLSETTRDVFSRELDFEGYRVWIARDDRPSSYTVLTSYDLEDYNRWEWSEAYGEFILRESPFTLQELRCLYGDSCGDTTWHPNSYPRTHPLRVPGNPEQIYYFEPQDYNRSVLANDPINATTDIRKVYPGAPKPPVPIPDSIRAMFPNGADSLYLTSDGFIKFYEYEYVIDHLLPTIPYWINVTAFDYGSPKSGLASLETSTTLLSLDCYALPSASEIEAKSLKVFVYPNPYRVDEDYRGRGFEDHDRSGFDDERVRRIHFANLPARCTIRIFTLDGDLVRQLFHDVDPADPMSTHDTWDLITRNFQQAHSGLYYWTVEEESGNTQIGKLVLIL
ncbi:MAG: hypothetical protein AB1772_04430 [Candidatus Zixiibacteriota bacterium]